MTQRMTAVFECDLRKFQGNPHLQDTPFGMAVTLAVGDALEAADLPPKVKPLEWQTFGTMAYVAQAPLFGRLRVEQFGRDDTWTVCFSVPGYSDTFIDGEWPTPDEAKNAAQKHYEQRILSALDWPS